MHCVLQWWLSAREVHSVAPTVVSEQSPRPQSAHIRRRRTAAVAGAVHAVRPMAHVHGRHGH
jgi:hypothetical protein